MSERGAKVWDKVSARVMEAAIMEKAKDEDFKRALLLSGDAVLVHQVRGQADLRLSKILHELRRALQNDRVETRGEEP
jgi:predicted NAD-dependent protein-ADP-ribosyltransferase YbiA (DUF1768 family)